MHEQDFILRRVDSSDINWLLEAAALSGAGFTSLLNDRKFIESRVATIEDSFAERNKPEERLYLFMREDLPEKRRIGICGIKANVGYHEAFYNYQISTVVQECEQLNLEVTHKIISAVNNFQTASELISFWLHPDFRSQRRGKYLSFCRFLFIAEHLHWFGDKTIAEIRGVSNDAGVSPFWEAVGKYFFAMDFATADAYTLAIGKEYIAELIGRDPIYLDLLPQTALDVIGVEHSGSTVARRILEKQGFIYNNHIDIFDAGPLLECNTTNIKTVMDCKKTKVAKIVDEVPNGPKALLYNCKVATACFTRTHILLDANGELIICASIANILGIANGDQVRYLIIT